MGMDPIKIGIERADQLVSRLLKIITVSAENPVQLPQRFGHRVGDRLLGRRVGTMRLLLQLPRARSHVRTGSEAAESGVSTEMNVSAPSIAP